jgi:hypothetical protein
MTFKNLKISQQLFCLKSFPSKTEIFNELLMKKCFMFLLGKYEGSFRALIGIRGQGPLPPLPVWLPSVHHPPHCLA